MNVTEIHWNSKYISDNIPSKKIDAVGYLQFVGETHIHAMKTLITHLGTGNINWVTEACTTLYKGVSQIGRVQFP